MQKRGCVKRHTVGCTEDLSVSHSPGELAHLQVPPGGGQAQSGAGSGSAGGNMRTRRTGLLTVTERPPGTFQWKQERMTSKKIKQKKAW